MTEFNKGDKLRCIDDKGCGVTLTLGNVYAVQKIPCRGSVSVLDDTTQLAGYYDHRFELAKSNPDTVELTPLVSQLRVYGKGKSYAKRDAYRLAVTVQYLTADTVYLSTAQGSIDANIRQLAFDKLKTIGVKHVKYEHTGNQYTVDL